MTKNLIAIAVLLILGIVVYYNFRSEPSPEKKQAAAAIRAVPAAEVDTIRIERYDGQGEDATKETSVLKKEDAKWSLVEPVKYAAVESAVERMVDALAELKVIDIISESKANHEKFKVDEKNGVIVKALSGDRELASLIVGNARSNVTFVRLPNSDNVFRVQGYLRSTFDKSPDSLRDKTILKFNLDDVGKVTFINSAGEFAYEQKAEGESQQKEFSPIGIEVNNFDAARLKTIVRSLSHLNAREFLDERLPVDQTGLGEDADKIVIETQEEGKPIISQLLLGKEDEEKRQTYVKTAGSDQVFLVSTSMLKDFRSKADDFARTDEDLKKEEERKANALKAQGAPGMPPAFSAPGNQQIPPDVMRKIQAQLNQQKKAP